MDLLFLQCLFQNSLPVLSVSLVNIMSLLEHDFEAHKVQLNWPLYLEMTTGSSVVQILLQKAPPAHL